MRLFSLSVQDVLLQLFKVCHTHLKTSKPLQSPFRAIPTRRSSIPQPAYRVPYRKRVHVILNVADVSVTPNLWILSCTWVLAVLIVMVLDIIHRYFKVQLPGYLKSLPLPKTFGGFAELTRDQWLELVPFLLFLFIVVYLILSPCIGALTKTKQRRPRVNRKQKLEEPKVVNTIDIEDLGKEAKERGGKVSYCRCWKSSKFPYCDGTHKTHNKETGDNVGPLVIKDEKTAKKE